MSTVLVAGIGNIFQGDDAFGCEVAQVLMGTLRRPNVRVVDFGIRSLDLTYALMDGPDLTILVDTIARGETPGTLYTIEPDAADWESGGQRAMDAHLMNPLEVLRAVKTLGGALKRILLVGCEPEDLGGPEGRMGLTAAVKAAIAPAATTVERLVREELSS